MTPNTHVEHMRSAFPAFTYYVLSFSVWIVAIAFKLPFFWRAVAFSVLLSINTAACFSTTGGPIQDYLKGSGFGNEIFIAVHILLLNDPDNDFRWNRQKGSPWSMSLFERAYWALSLVYSPRGVGWNYQVANIPPRPKHSRIKFIWTRFVHLAWYYFILDMAQSYMALNPLFHSPGRNAPSLGSQGFVFRVANILASVGTGYAIINMLYDVCAIPAVASGLTEVGAWPNIFGNWRDAYTVRRFWGRTWHQCIRRFVADIGKFFCRLFGFTPGTYLSRYIQLYVAFTVSGLVHCFGDFMVAPEYILRSLPFFVFQAFAIHFEDSVINIGSRHGIRQSRAAEMIGFIWTFLWFCWSTPLWIDWLVGAGMGSEPMLPILITPRLLSIVFEFPAAAN